MAGQLVTIATFGEVSEAHIARSALEAAGIPVTLNNEESSSLFGQSTPVLGSARLVVREEDEERAVKILDETFGNQPVNEADLAAVAESAEPEAEPPAESRPIADDAESKPSERDEYARRFFLAAVFALFLAPLWFYALYLCLNAAFGEGPISERGQSHLILGGVTLVIGFLLVVIFFMLL
ncbi:MAG: DUF2007 domain-containing protein [Planctomycetia bacterium]|nr:DUF2007 domain-containing protein [Planctomycetia bacterium]